MTAWRLKAACFDHPDLAPDAWDTPAESQWSRPENLRALRVCLGCPVVVECLQDVMAIDRGRTTTPVRDNTIRGGLIPGQRTALARGQRPRWVAGLGRLQAQVINTWARRAGMKRDADTLIAAEIDRSPIPPISDDERRAASLFVCAAAADVDDARLLLDALGLLDAPVTSVLPVRQIRPQLRRKS